MIKTIIATIGLIAVAASPAIAKSKEKSFYVSGTVGVNLQDDSSNSGSTTADFLTGNGGDAIPNGTNIASGTPIGWNTEFDSGLSLSAAFGVRVGDNWRNEIQVFNTQSDVDSHDGVSVGGTDIDAVDAAVLTGSDAQLGATVGAVVSDGRGDISTYGIMFNGYYDIANSSRVTPYIGLGIGYAQTEVTYNPSGVGIVDDDAGSFAYQAIVGASLELTEQLDVFGQYTYRDAGDESFDVDLFPASLDIENKSNLFEVGARFTF